MSYKTKIFNCERYFSAFDELSTWTDPSQISFVNSLREYHLRNRYLTYPQLRRLKQILSKIGYRKNRNTNFTDFKRSAYKNRF